jgi:hypothetical protein
MLFALLYVPFRRVIGSARQSEDRELDIEVLVLRHQVKVLSRNVGRPKLHRIDKVKGSESPIRGPLLPYSDKSTSTALWKFRQGDPW